MSNLINKLVSASLIALGAALFVLNLLGLVLSVSVIDEKHGQSHGAIPGYSYQVQNTSRLKSMLDKPMDSFDLKYVNNTIFESIIHSDKRKIKIHENWLLWLGSYFYSPLGKTQLPDRIISGEGALCSEVAAIMNHIAELNGYQSRFIGLNGHVVSEVLTDDGWRVADPDYGVVYPVGLSILESEEGSRFIKERLIDRGYSNETIQSYISLFKSSEDNTQAEVNTANSPRLYAIEKASEVLKWVFSIIAIIVGIIIRKTHNKKIQRTQKYAPLI